MDTTESSNRPLTSDTSNMPSDNNPPNTDTDNNVATHAPANIVHKNNSSSSSQTDDGMRDDSKNSNAMTDVTKPSDTSQVVSLQAYNDAIARLDVEVRARHLAESALTEARARISFLERHLLTLSSNASPSKPPSAAPAPVALPAAAPTPAGRPEKEILSHCSDISNCNKAMTSNSGNGSAGGGSNTAATANIKNASTSSSKKSPNGKKLGGVSKTGKGSSSATKTSKAPKIPGQSRYWTPDEHKLFLEALQEFGHKDLRSISKHVGTRNMTQVRTHSQKYFMRLMREAKRQNPTPASQPAAQNSSSSTTTTTTSVPPSSGPNSAGSTTATNNSNLEVKAHVGNTGAQNNQQPQVTDSNTNNSVSKPVDESDKYSVPNTCGMTLLCLVGEDTRV